MCLLHSSDGGSSLLYFPFFSTSLLLEKVEGLIDIFSLRKLKHMLKHIVQLLSYYTFFFLNVLDRNFPFNTTFISLSSALILQVVEDIVFKILFLSSLNPITLIANNCHPKQIQGTIRVTWFCLLLN